MAKKKSLKRTSPMAPDASRVIVRQSSIHATGCFAACDIKKGAQVIEYVGPHLSKEESAKECENENVYIFSLNDKVDINGNVDWNPARFINHSCAPNCESENDDEHIWILAIKDIKAGEELTYNYGFDVSEYKEYPCNCGTPECVGYMVAVEHFEHARNYRKEQLALAGKA